MAGPAGPSGNTWSYARVVEPTTSFWPASPSGSSVFSAKARRACLKRPCWLPSGTRGCPPESSSLTKNMGQPPQWDELGGRQSGQASLDA
jgi:hypothetical protein